MTDEAGRQGVRRPRSSPEDRRTLVLDVAEPLFRAHGVRAVGMDQLIAATGLGKMSVYRVFPTKDDLVEAYLQRLAARILGFIDADIGRSADRPDLALLAILDAVEADVARADFRGCPFGNAAGEFDDPAHPARRIATEYRRALLDRLTRQAVLLDPVGGRLLGRRLAVLVDGAYLSGAHLGHDGPASTGLDLARALVAAAAGDQERPEAFSDGGDQRSASASDPRASSVTSAPTTTNAAPAST